MLSGDKIANSATSHYKIMIESSQPDSNCHIGRLRGSFGSTQFYIYGDGLNPARADKLKINLESQLRL